MPLTEADLSLDTPLGQVIKLHCKFIESKTKSSIQARQVKVIAKQLKESKKNLLPVFVKQTGEDTYLAELNVQVLDAAKQANLDFVWCMVVNDEMLEQVKREAGLLKTPPKPKPSKGGTDEIKPVVDPPKEKPLEDMTVKELKEKAKQLKIPGYSKMKKDELVEAITKLS